MQNNLLTIQKEGRPAIVNPGFLYAALNTIACAAFTKESRMNFANATKLRRKSGGTHRFSERSWV
jgi:hypothetical protein